MLAPVAFPGHHGCLCLWVSRGDWSGTTGPSSSIIKPLGFLLPNFGTATYPFLRNSFQHPYHCTPQARKGVFGYLGWGSLNCTMPKNILWVLGWRSKHPYHCTPQARKGVFGSLGWVCLKCTMSRNVLWVLGWRSKHPYHCTPRAKKVFLDPHNGCV